MPVVSRRQIILGSSSLILTGCYSYDDGCQGSDPLDQARCRQVNVRNQLAKNVTVGVLVGAALGAGFAAAAGGNPALGGLIGAAAGGSIAFAKNYYDFKLEEANYNAALAIHNVKLGIQEDIDTFIRISNDNRLAIANLLDTFSNNIVISVEEIARASKSESVKRDAYVNIKTLDTTRENYNVILRTTPLQTDPSASNLMDRFNKQVKTENSRNQKALELLKSMSG